MTSVETGADQLVRPVCRGFGVLHAEQQETLATGCYVKLSGNTGKPKILVCFVQAIYTPHSVHEIKRERYDGAYLMCCSIKEGV